MKKIDEEAVRKLAISIVNDIEENMGVGGMAAIGPAQAGNGFAGSLSNIGGVGTGSLPNGVGNVKAKGEKGDSKGAPGTHSSASKNEYGKLPKQAAIQVMALINKVNGPLGRKSSSVGNVASVSTTVSGVKSTIERIGKN
jgi:hypothetical protein